MFLFPMSKNDIHCAISSQKASQVSINISLSVNLSPPLNQKRRTQRSSENIVLIPLTTPVDNDQEKLGCRSRKQKRKKYMGIVIGLSFRFNSASNLPTIWFSTDSKRQSHKRSQKRMETF